MHKTLIALAALLAASPALPQASAAIAAGKAQPSPLAPSEIVAAAPKADWTGIAQSDLLVMDLAPDAKGRAQRVVIQLMHWPFSQSWVGNVRTLAKAHWWDGMAINRVQDNYVVQWGDPNADDKVKAKPLPPGLPATPKIAGRDLNWSCFESDCDLLDYPVKLGLLYPNSPMRGDDPDKFIKDFGAAWWGTKIGLQPFDQKLDGDNYAGLTDFRMGWPIAVSFDQTAVVPHCYGMVGVGRDMPPDSGNGAELYVVIGHAPRHLDRNIALVGRVIEGIEHLSSLPRGHGALGFYDLAQGDERTGIVSIRLGSEVKDLGPYEYLSTESASFARYADARANRRDAFFIRPAGGADICNIPVPVRRVK